MAQDGSQSWLTMNRSHQSASLKEDLGCFDQSLAFLWAIQQQLIEAAKRKVDGFKAAKAIPTVIFCNMSQPAATSNRGGQMPSVGNFSKEETMHLLMILEKHLPIGSEAWEGVAL